MFHKKVYVSRYLGTYIVYTVNDIANIQILTILVGTR